MNSINGVHFPHAQEGDRVLFEDIYYVFTNGEWVKE